MSTCALILAAGEGTRMKSKHPKVSHKILGRPMVNWVIAACKDAQIDHQIVVIGNGAEEVRQLIMAEFGEGTIEFVEQTERKGTGHAAMVAADKIAGLDASSLVVLSGDSPLITGETLNELLTLREQAGAGVALLTMTLDDSTGYGRVICDENDHVDRIVEQKDATPEELATTRCNSGIYAFDRECLLEGLPSLTCDNAQGEYYLTDLIGIMREQGLPIVAIDAGDANETLGVNSRVQMSVAAGHMQRRINEELMAGGVTMMDPATVWVGPGVRVGNDSELLPMTFLMGDTSVGSDCVVGPNSRLTDTVVGDGCVLEETVAIGAVLENNVHAGPRAYLRPGTHMCNDSKAGTHVEIKKSYIGEGSKVPHLTYLGDATLGTGVNIGAGTITCNYDGVNKHPTHIGDGAFIGSDTMLVAPVTIGAHAVTGAGSCITRDVPDGALALERSEQKVKENYVSPAQRAKQAE